MTLGGGGGFEEAVEGGTMSAGGEGTAIQPVLVATALRHDGV